MILQYYFQCQVRNPGPTSPSQERQYSEHHLTVTTWSSSGSIRPLRLEGHLVLDLVRHILRHGSKCLVRPSNSSARKPGLGRGEAVVDYLRGRCHPSSCTARFVRCRNHPLAVFWRRDLGRRSREHRFRTRRGQFDFRIVGRLFDLFLGHNPL